MWGSAVQIRAGLQLGGLAQLARALALQARGQGFDSLALHQGVSDSFFLVLFKRVLPIINGGLAQLARALALQARGQGFDSLALHVNFLIGL